MADMGTVVDVSSIKEELIFFEEYMPLGLHEEEVIAEPVEVEEVIVEQGIDNAEVIEATSSILPKQEYDPLDPSQWTHEEIVIDSTGNFIKEEIVEQALVYECYKCAKRFNLKDKLFKHMKLHHARGDDMVIEKDGKRIWTCTQCDKTFISRKGSIIHQRTHTGERPYSCNVCQKRFIDSSTLMKHQVIHQAVRPFSCMICRRGFNQKVALQRHERTHGQMQPTFKCKYCPKTFLVSSSLQAHEKIHSGIKPYTCQYCSSRFHTSTAQRQHERVHTNERPYQCNYCPKAFKDSGTLFKHQVIHSGIKPFVCPICSQGFTQKVALRKHIRSHVSRNNENTCEVCETQYFSKDDLCAHVEEHIEQHPNLSHVRSVASSSLKAKLEVQKSLEENEAIHSVVATLGEHEPVTTIVTATITTTSSSTSGGGSGSGTGDLSDLATLCDVAISTAGDLAHSYPCLHCGMSFRRKKSLDSHLSIHRLNCKYCERPFADKTSLEAHERRLCNDTSPINQDQQSSHEAHIIKEELTPITVVTTTSKNPKRFFYCERCDKTFSSRNGYIIHQRSHTGERPYPCRWCDKAFGDSATRHKHERIHTGERPFKCTRCPRAFNQRAALRAHQITHTVDRAFICKFCPSSFPYFATLKRHQQACHSHLICPICSTSFNDTKKLHEHLKTKHIGDPNLMCTLCDSGIFTDVDEYCDHMIWHSKQHQTGTKLKEPKRKSSPGKRPRTKSPSPEIIILPKEEPVYEEIIEEFPIIEGQYSCDMCGILYDDKEQLKLHIPVHF